MQQSLDNISPRNSWLKEDELGDLMINQDIHCSVSAIFTDLKNNKYYLPQYKTAEQTGDGGQLYAPSLNENGQLIFYLQSFAPSNISSQLQGITPCRFAPSIYLVYNGNSQKIQLTSEVQANNIWQAKANLDSSQQTILKTILYDLIPSATLRITGTVTFATKLTEDFIKANWSHPEIRKALLNLFGGTIPISSAEQYISVAIQPYPDLYQQYMVLDATYVNEIQAPPLPSYIQYSITYDNKVYKYYQDNQQLNRVFYLPDSFELDVNPHGKPSVSLLQFNLPENISNSTVPESNVEKLQATFRFFAKPQINFDRFRNATEQLTQKIGQKLEMLSLQYAHDVSMKFTLGIPNEQGTGNKLILQEQAQINLDEGLKNELNLSFRSFKALWEAIFSNAPEQTIFTGWVDVSLSSGKYLDRISFRGRMDASKMEEYWDDIISQDSQIVFSKGLRCQTFPQIFEKTDYPNDPIMALSLDFGKTSVGLSPQVLEAEVTLERPVEDIVFNRADIGRYPYTLRVVRPSGIKCGSLSTDSEIIFITTNDIKQCNQDCSH